MLEENQIHRHSGPQQQPKESFSSGDKYSKEKFLKEKNSTAAFFTDIDRGKSHRGTYGRASHPLPKPRH